MKRRFCFLLVAALASPVAAPGAFAQAWPGKTLRIVVPYTPGGSSDIIARAIAPPLGEALKTTVIVENKPGANGNTGTWQGLLVPPGTPTEVVARLSAEFATFFEREKKRWAAVVSRGGVKIE